MKVLMINGVPYGSPAKIMYGIAKIANESGIETLTATGYSSHPAPETPNNNIIISGKISKSIHMIISRFTGMHGCYSILSTIKFVRMVRKYQPDLVHFHNLHGWYINLPMIFKYIKKVEIPVIWTLHDCWAFTGQCPYFSIAKCDKWKKGCDKCSTYQEYPQSFFDRTKKMWKLKKKWFLNVKNLTIVTPSRWLEGLVSESFLKKYPVKVINNGIDLNIYKPTESDIKRKYKISQEKKIILGVAIGWGVRKGLDVFNELAKRLSDNYQIVLVGTDELVEKIISEKIICIRRTQNQKELAEIYSASDLFVNPTREDNYPTVNMEAIACGTPVLTFDTGGSPECISSNCGGVIECDNVDSLEQEIIKICEKNTIDRGKCLSQSQDFNMYDRFAEYIELYREVLDYDKK